MKIFSIFDEKAEAYLQPFFMETIGQAERALIDCLGDPNHNFSRHPADYTLFVLGEFDNATGHIEFAKTGIVNLVELKPKVNNLVELPTKIGGTE